MGFSPGFGRSGVGKGVLVDFRCVLGAWARGRSVHDGLERLPHPVGRHRKWAETGFGAAGLQRFRDAGVHKFILRPIAQGGEDVLKQTRLLIERALPEVAGLN